MFQKSGLDEEFRVSIFNVINLTIQCQLAVVVAFSEPPLSAPACLRRDVSTSIPSVRATALDSYLLILLLSKDFPHHFSKVQPLSMQVESSLHKSPLSPRLPFHRQFHSRLPPIFSMIVPQFSVGHPLPRVSTLTHISSRRPYCSR